MSRAKSKASTPDPLLAAVREEVLAYGVRRATLTSVAARAGLSRGERVLTTEKSPGLGEGERGGSGDAGAHQNTTTIASVSLSLSLLIFISTSILPDDLSVGGWDGLGETGL